MDRYSNFELRKFFVSYWLFHSVLYNFAQALNNRKKRRFVWAITNYYYSTMYIARLFLFLSTSKYFKRHIDLSFFYVNRQPNGKILKLNNIGEIEEERGTLDIKKVKEKLNLNEKYLIKFGNFLENFRKLRNTNTYEPFIIYAQENHTITNFLQKNVEKIENICKRYVKDSCNIFLKFWKNQNEIFISLLRHDWLLPNTNKTIEKHGLNNKEIQLIINELNLSLNLIKLNKEKYEKLRKDFENICKISNFNAKKDLISKVTTELNGVINNLIGGGE